MYKARLQHTELYKELENINTKAILNLEREFYAGAQDAPETPPRIIQHQTFNGVLWRIKEDVTYKVTTTQFEVFTEAMKIILLCGQCLGLNPVLGILESEPSKVRVNYKSWRFSYSFLILSSQALATFLCLYRLSWIPMNITMLAFISFYGSTCLSTLLFMRVASKWPTLIQEITNCGLDEYVNLPIQSKCKAAAIIFIVLSVLEHFLAFTARISAILDCFPEQDLYETFIAENFPFIMELGVPYHLSLGVICQIVQSIDLRNWFGYLLFQQAYLFSYSYKLLFQFINVTSTLTWNYADVFIICMSLYLNSILDKLNEKIIFSKDKILPPSFWGSLRDDYTRATRLIRTFDDVISSTIFTSFATNLFFICLQLFNILANGLKSKQSEHTIEEQCPNFPSGPFGGYEHAIYFSFSLMYIFGRSLLVSLITANVHSASLLAAPALFDIPSIAYCDEVQRFIEQVTGDTVALSGLQFFYVTKELVLSIAGTVVTYELVLLQFSGEDLIQNE